VTERLPITIDGSAGEGGGQILRTALALSLVTGKPFRIEKIRAGRDKPGLLRQHLTAVEAAAAIGQARARGAASGSRELAFEPGAIVAGDHRFAVGTAGSATLVLQTILPALAIASGPSRLVLEGGTHNPFAPPFEFLDRAFLPLLRRMGADVRLTLERPGFYPAGGGRFRALIQPAGRFERLELLERGAVERRLARALVANLPLSIAERELRELGAILGLEKHELRSEDVKGSAGPGNVLLVEVTSEHLTEVFAGFGQRGVSAEQVARDTGEQVRSYLAAGVPVGEHLADQLLLPMAMAGGGAFRTMAPTQHALTNADVIRRFLDVEVAIAREGEQMHRVEIRS
jgi:RNA 3'-terminal phosphate cyclase (ATP)